MTATPSTSANEVNDSPAANQNDPRSAGKNCRTCSSSAIGSPGRAAGSSALMNG